MKTLIGMAAVGVPMTMAVSGELSAGLLAVAGAVAGGCWIVSGWLSH
jgi:hypothetical protein